MGIYICSINSRELELAREEKIKTLTTHYYSLRNEACLIVLLAER